MHGAAGPAERPSLTAAGQVRDAAGHQDSALLPPVQHSEAAAGLLQMPRRAMLLSMADSPRLAVAPVCCMHILLTHMASLATSSGHNTHAQTRSAVRCWTAWSWKDASTGAPYQVLFAETVHSCRKAVFISCQVLCTSRGACSLSSVAVAAC